MKNFVSEHRILALVISGIVVLVIGSVILGSFLLYRIQGIPKPTGTTETSGCTTSSAPKGKTLYVLSKSRSDSIVYISAVDTKGQERWTQIFATLSAPSTRGSLEEKNGLIYAFVTSQVQQRRQVRPGHTVLQFGKITNIAAAYDANSGNKLWNMQAPTDGLIEGMSICNDMIYLWTGNAIYAYNAKDGSPLWRSNKITLLNLPRIVVTNNAIVLMSRGKDIYHVGIYALNPKNGTLLWKVDFPKRNQSGQYVALSLTATDKAVYASQFNRGSPQKVDALSISNGKLLWNTFVNMNIANNFIRSPSTIVGNNVLYSYTSNTGLVALNVNNGTHLWDESNVYQLQPLQDRLYVTHAKASDLCQLDPTTGKSQWCKFPIQTGYPIKAVSDQTTLYIAGTAGVSALQKDNGKISWVYKENTSRAALMVTYGLSLDY